MPTEISVRNILSQRFNDGGDADSARRLVDPAEHGDGALDKQENPMTSQKRTSNRYKRDLGDSVSPDKRAQGSNERLPSNIHSINRSATDAFPGQGRGAERAAEPHRSDHIIVDSAGASTLTPYSKRNVEATSTNSGLGARDIDHRSAQLPHDYADNFHAKGRSGERKPTGYVSLRGPRSASRSYSRSP